MKAKLIILAALAAILYSCSSDRDNEMVNPPKSEHTMKTESILKNFGADLKTEEANNDSISTGSPVSSGITPPLKLESDESEIVDPTKPDKPW